MLKGFDGMERCISLCMLYHKADLSIVLTCENTDMMYRVVLWLTISYEACFNSEFERIPIIIWSSQGKNYIDFESHIP